MSHLNDLQQAFQDFVRTSPESPDQAVPNWVSPGGRAMPEKQLSIYSNAYRVRLQEVLAIDFPAVLSAVGDDVFDQLSEGYIDAHPSHYYSLREFGRDLPAYLLQHPDCAEQAWLAELAQFERLLCEAFDVADAPIFSEQDMAGVAAEDWPNLRMVMHPSVQKLDCIWGAPGLWQALTAKTPEEITPTQQAPVSWLVWRQQLDIQYQSLTADEALVFNAAVAGLSFDEICGELSALMAEGLVPLHFATLLKGWISQGIVCGIE